MRALALEASDARSPAESKRTTIRLDGSSAARLTREALMLIVGALMRLVISRNAYASLK